MWKYLLVFEKLVFYFYRSSMQILTVNTNELYDLMQRIPSTQVFLST